jgi:hypothetical protein
MNKHLIGIMILLIPVQSWAQQESTKSKKVSEVVRQKIQTQLEHAILRYKQFTCPEIKKESYMTVSPGLISYIDPKGFFFPDSIDATSYQLIFDSIEPWGPQPSNYGYYMVTKRDHRFTNFEKSVRRNKNWKEGKDPLQLMFFSTPPFQDTVSLHLYSKYYPQDEIFLVYCDTVPANLISLLSGNLFMTPATLKNKNLRYWAFTRMAQYNTTIETFRQLPSTEKHFRFLAKKSNLTTGGFLLEMEKEYPHHMQITYYTNDKTKTGGNPKDYYEVIIPRPVGEFKGYEPIKPRMRKLSREEGIQVRKNRELFPQIWEFTDEEWEDE